MIYGDRIPIHLLDDEIRDVEREALREVARLGIPFTRVYRAAQIKGDSVDVVWYYEAP